MRLMAQQQGRKQNKRVPADPEVTGNTYRIGSGTASNHGVSVASSWRQIQVLESCRDGVRPARCLRNLITNPAIGPDKK